MRTLPATLALLGLITVMASPTWAQSKSSQLEQDEKLYKIFDDEDMGDFDPTRPPENLHPPAWWKWIQIEGHYWRPQVDSNISSTGSLVGTELDEDDFEIEQGKGLFLFGQLRLGPGATHIRLAYMNGRLTGDDPAGLNYNFHNTAVTSGTTVDTEISVQDFFADLNGAFFTYVRPEGVMVHFRGYLGAGFLSIKSEVDPAGSAKDQVNTDVPTWHAGFNLEVAPWKFFSFYIDVNGGYYNFEDLEVKDVTVLRARGGFTISMTSHVRLSLDYRFHYYRANENGTVHRLALHGPSASLVLNY